MRIHRVLIVDDGGIGSSKLGDCLAADRIDVSVAESGRDIIAIADELRPEVLVLGATLDPVAGCDLCRRLECEFPLVDVLVIVSVADIQDLEAVVDAGANDFAVSPIHEPELRRRVDNLLARRI